jgi:hypothetical protein
MLTFWVGFGASKTHLTDLNETGIDRRLYNVSKGRMGIKIYAHQSIGTPDRFGCLVEEKQDAICK